MNALGLFGAFGTLFAAGYGLLALLVRRSVRLSLTEQIAFSWLFGTGAVSLLLWVFGFLADGLLLQGLVSVVCISLGMVGWKLKTPLHICSKPRWFEVVLTAVITVEIAIVFYLSFVHTLGWDGLLNWEIKARYAFANGGVLPAAYFSDTGRAFSHPEYPLAVPFNELWLYLWLGESNQFCAKTIFPMFYVAGTFLVAAFTARLSRRTWLGLLMAALLFFVPQITVEVGCASAGYADFPLSAFYLAAVGCLFCASKQGNDVFFRLYAACSGPVAMGQARRSYFMDRRSGLRCLRHFADKKVPIVILCIPARDRNHLWVASLSDRHARTSGGRFFAIQSGDVTYPPQPCAAAAFRACGRIL